MKAKPNDVLRRHKDFRYPYWQDDKLKARFFSKVDKQPDKDHACWLWKGYNDREGYGLYMVYQGKGLPDLVFFAHRLAWMLQAEAPIPKGMYVRHACRVKGCMLLAHLFLADSCGNVRYHGYRPDERIIPDEWAEEGQGPFYRNPRSLTLRGEMNGNSKLDKETALALKHLLSLGYGVTALAQANGLPVSTVNNIHRGLAWAWATPD